MKPFSLTQVNCEAYNIFIYHTNNWDFTAKQHGSGSGYSDCPIKLSLYLPLTKIEKEDFHA